MGEYQKFPWFDNSLPINDPRFVIHGDAIEWSRQTDQGRTEYRKGWNIYGDMVIESINERYHVKTTYPDGGGMPYSTVVRLHLTKV